MKIVYYILFLLLLSGLVTAIKPGTITQFSEGGCQIDSSKIEYLKENSDFKINVHVINTTTGIPLTNNTIGCYLHYYSNNGSHAYINNTPSFDHSFDFEFMIPGKFVSQREQSYIITCNGSGVGCFVSDGFIVTNNGLPDYQSNTQSTAVSIFLILLPLLFLFVPYFIKEQFKTKEMYLVISRLSNLLGLFLLLLSCAIFMNLAINGALGILSELKTILYVISIVCYISMFAVALRTVIDLVNIYDEKKRKKESGEDGDE